MTGDCGNHSWALCVFMFHSRRPGLIRAKKKERLKSVLRLLHWGPHSSAVSVLFSRERSWDLLTVETFLKLTQKFMISKKLKGEKTQCCVVPANFLWNTPLVKK